MVSVARPVPPTTPEAPRLSPEQRYAVNAAYRELSKLTWEMTGQVVPLDDAETIVLCVLVEYFKALDTYRGPRAE